MECKDCKNFFCEGTDKAPQRSLFNALGMTKEEMERPLVGIVSSYNEIVPGHMNIDGVEAESGLKQKIYSVGGQLLNKVKQELAGLETALDKTAKKLEEGQNALHTTKRYTARLQKQLEAVQLLDEEDKHDKE